MDKDLQLGADLGPLHRTVRRALLKGCTPGANRLRGSPTSSYCLDGSAALPQRLGGHPSDPRRGRRRPLAPAGSENNLYIRGCSAPDNQRMKASRGSARIRLLWRTRRRHRIVNLARDGHLCRESMGGVVGAVEEMVRWSRPLLRPPRRVDSAGWVPPRFGGTRTAECRTRMGRLLVLMNGASHRSRARAHIILTRGRLRPPQRCHFNHVGGTRHSPMIPSKKSEEKPSQIGGIN
jgi:hypothetical protein